jgi:hypothetical protein
MSRPDEQLSTRDLASTPAEPRDETDAADERTDLQTSTRHNETDQDPGDRDADVAASATQPAAVRPADRDEPGVEPEADPSTDRADPAREDGDDARLLADDEGAELSSRWEAIQVTFVDDPRRAVEEADGLVAHVMQQLADGFARERETLEGQWSRGEDVSTEDLRVALQRYRSFFQRLLSA